MMSVGWVGYYGLKRVIWLTMRSLVYVDKYDKTTYIRVHFSTPINWFAVIHYFKC